MPITDYDGQLQTIARNLGEEPSLTNTDGLLEAIAKGTENVIKKDDLLDLVPTGCVQAFAGATTPDGWLLCDGSAVSRTDYADLYAVIGTTYGAGDGSTTFNLPNLVDKFVEGSATAGTEKTAGLPNIKGGYELRPWGSGSAILNPTGAVISDGLVGLSANQIATTSTGMASQKIRFDASNSNAIYGNSATVQPPALTMRYIIKY